MIGCFRENSTVQISAVKFQFSRLPNADIAERHEFNMSNRYQSQCMQWRSAKQSATKTDGDFEPPKKTDKTPLRAWARLAARGLVSALSNFRQRTWHQKQIKVTIKRGAFSVYDFFNELCFLVFLHTQQNNEIIQISRENLLIIRWARNRGRDISFAVIGSFSNTACNEQRVHFWMDWKAARHFLWII